MKREIHETVVGCAVLCRVPTAFRKTYCAPGGACPSFCRGFKFPELNHKPEIVLAFTHEFGEALLLDFNSPLAEKRVK